MGAPYKKNGGPIFFLQLSRGPKGPSRWLKATSPPQDLEVCARRAPYLLVSNITGHTKPRQGTPEKKAENRISKQTPNRFYVENPTGTRVHLLNVCHSGRSALCRSSAELARHWFVPVISVSSH